MATEHADGALPEPIAGWLCLEFTNTADARADGQWGEYLGSYSRLLEWARQQEVLSPAESATVTT